MRTCDVCGLDTGNYDRHFECGEALRAGRDAEEIRTDVLSRVPHRTEADELVEKLTPVLMKAAKHGALIAAFTLAGISIAAGILVAVLHGLLS